MSSRFSRYLCVMLCLCALTRISVSAGVPRTFQKTIKLMGSRFELVAVTEDSTLAWFAIDAGIAEIERIEVLISSWNPVSQTSEVNRQAGIYPVKVHVELFELIRRSKKISRLTGGIFDISFASVDKIWKFDGSMTRLPTETEMRVSVSKINYQDILLDKTAHTVYLKQEGMKIGFGAIGKGYAANRAKSVMVAMGIASGVVNAGGDLTAWGKQPDGQPWHIGITDPRDKQLVIGWLNISETAVVTSGNYEKFVAFEGRRYSHILHPKTGMPVTGTKSVTVVCADAELADALATAVYILGGEAGIELINQLNGIECLLINDRGEMITSEHLKLNYYSTGKPYLKGS